VNPLLPLAEALLAQGDRVVVATRADPVGDLARSGVEVWRAGHGEMDWFDTLRGRVRGFPGDGLAPKRINHYFVPRLFAEIGTADMIDDVLACGRELQPDVVIFETYAFAGPVAAQVLDVVGVHHLIGSMLAHDVMELVNDAVCPLWRSFGCEAPVHAGMYGGISIAVVPPSLEVVTAPAGEWLAMRPVPMPRQSVGSSGPPRVYATLGTFFGGNVDVFRAMLDGLAGENVEVVVTVGADQDPGRLDPVPVNARVERFIPQAELLPTCSAVIHHGGSGTMLGSLAHGLPQVVVPQGADNFINGELLARAGAARVLLPGEVSAGHVRDAVRSILEVPSYAQAALRLAGEMAGMATPADVARTLRERLAGAG